MPTKLFFFMVFALMATSKLCAVYQLGHAGNWRSPEKLLLSSFTRHFKKNAFYRYFREIHVFQGQKLTECPGKDA